MSRLKPRHWSRSIAELLDAFPVVVVTGARQVGKSTLAQQLVGERGGTYVTLDDVTVRAHALADAQGFVQGLRGFVVIDEVQTAPELLRTVKLSVDNDRRPGRFLLTGSANLLQLKSVTESLAGRSAWVELPPLLWSELAERPTPTTLDAAFLARNSAELVGQLANASADHAEQARELAATGTMPPTLGFTPRQRRAWYDGYRQTFIERDLRQLAHIENLPEFVRLLTMAAVRSANLLNKSALAADSGLTHPTLRRYLSLLEVAYQFYELPPYFVNLGKRLVKTSKLYAVDSGLVAHLAGVESWAEAARRGLSGQLFETWAVGELRALSRLSSRAASVCFWRTSAGQEVDLVFERGDRVVAIEIKSSATVTPEDTRGLRALREGLGTSFQLGIVAYLGDTALPLDEGLCAVPMASLLGAA